MVLGRKADGSSPFTASLSNSSISARNLRKGHLGGVIFGCKNSTIKECLFKQLFGLPAQHFLYVKNVDPGLPLFLFNYSDRKLHGIFEAASPGQMNINPYGWTTDGAERTLYPAQVQIRVRLQCQPLPEEQFRPIIADNYYSQSHFWFELDHAQASKLISLLSSRAVAPSASVPQNSAAWRTLFRPLPLCNKKEEGEDSKPPSKIDSAHSDQLDRKLGSSDVAPCLDESNLPLEASSDKQVVENDEKGLILLKLQELVLNREYKDSSSSSYVEDSAVVNDSHLDDKGLVKEQMVLEDRNEDSPVSSSDFHPVIAQLIREELKGFKAEYIQRMSYMEQRLADAEKEIQQLKEHCMMLESICSPSMSLVDQTVNESFDEMNMDPDDLIFLVGGCDGESWLSTLDSYSPSQDMKKSLSPMTMPRSYASVAVLNGELYIFGGGNGSEWYDTVEAYNLVSNEWTLRAPLNKEKGSLAGATLNGKIFALGGGNGIECFSDVDMFDLDVGRWIPTRSMLQKRFALGAAELNGVLYAVGGYDGKDYLNSVERLDPREHSWTRIGGMKTKRGSHTVVVLNEKLYAMGGFDGNTMVPSVEIYDPRVDSWMDGDSMNQSRGYSAAAVVNKSIYVIGGVEDGENVVGTVELYEEGEGWRVIKQTAIGKRCFASAIVP
ncbi:uncharacterized protein LOC100267149 isoform X3 [Vitis vinifera]|uniref:DCD domain-containing protein n=3 Tax=Vitis vinifera TaxID=29760 RepID=F6GXS9_VITVI|nr:uncharacterized protein LOC100267149 isoform X3 [Vitis vinifera]XP_010653378.1 uncharacterized protein LOC100267149 isoform X3 [Vitis vinifera]|eukprot:XP_002264808.1 PREDICTED: uncharacterized protein LOC100267149 isoform X2 [Vitis vinifera]